ncbi:MAG: sugar transferase [Thermoguttaceae bacterium]
MSSVVRKAFSVREPVCRTALSDETEMVSCSPYFRWKAWGSRLAAAVILIPALPVMALLIVLVRLTSRGPGLYRQVRVGRHGRSFLLYKIRTMRHDAEAKTGPVWTEPRDPRITWLGRFLRRVHLDELPQLFNVLRGEMVLVGPRPERPEFTQYLAREIPGYMDRYLVAPGITGLAQINLPPDTDVDSVRRKLVLDVQYIRTASLSLDLRILLCTSLRLIGLPGLKIAQWLGLVSVPEIPGRMMRPAVNNGAPTTYCVRLTCGAEGKVAASEKCEFPAD